MASIPAADLPLSLTVFGKAIALVIMRAGRRVGFSIAYQLIAHGGRIHVTSTVGAGTTFTVELPAADRQMTR